VGHHGLPPARLAAITLPASISYPLIVNGVARVTTGSTVYALREATGTALWSTGAGGSG